jgi:hypothetical protein
MQKLLSTSFTAHLVTQDLLHLCRGLQHTKPCSSPCVKKPTAASRQWSSSRKSGGSWTAVTSRPSAGNTLQNQGLPRLQNCKMMSPESKGSKTLLGLAQCCCQSIRGKLESNKPTSNCVHAAFHLTRLHQCTVWPT